jgi:hypothetical protein
MARDCTVNKGAAFVGDNPGSGPGGSPSQAMVKGGFDSEYASLMAELGKQERALAPILGGVHGEAESATSHQAALAFPLGAVPRCGNPPWDQ